MQLRIVVTGASGQLGSYVLDRLGPSGHEVIGWSRAVRGERAGFPIEPVDLLDPDAMIAALDRIQPDAILHLAAVSRVDQAFHDPEAADAVNARATGVLAARAAAFGSRLVFASTDLVFDGARPWREEDDPAEPILTYGRTKRDAERRVFIGPRNVVARLSLLYGPSRNGTPTFLDGVFAALRSGEPRSLFVDEYRTPLDYATAADALVRLVEEPDHAGIFHVGGIERLSRFEMVHRLASHAGLPTDLLAGNCRDDVPSPEPRPADVSLDSLAVERALRGFKRPTLEAGLDRCRSQK